MRLLHFADIHFGMENYGRLDPKTGLHSRFGDFVRSFQALIDFAIGNNKRHIPPINKGGPVDLVIFAGDAYKTRDPSPTYMRAFGEGIRTIAATGVPVVMIVGNHDLPLAAGKANTLDIFQALAVPRVFLSREPEYLVVETRSGPVQIVTLPWMYKSQLLGKDRLSRLTGEEAQRHFQDKVTTLFRAQLIKIKPSIPAIGIVHATVEEATYGSERTVLLGSDIVVPKNLLTSSKLNYVALGHIHRYQKINEENPPVVYSGSLERIDFGEEHEAKGFIKVEISAEKTVATFVPVPVRRFLTIDVRIQEDDPDPTETVVQRAKKSNVREAIVRVVIHCPESKASLIRELPIREALGQATFIDGIVKQVTRGQRVAQEKGYSDELLSSSPLNALDEYWKKRDIPPSRREKLHEAAKELIDVIEST
jgi:exonuclease SbcD